MRSIHAAVLKEWKTIFRFVTVGGSSFAVKVLVYALLSRLIWEQGPRSLENIMAIMVSMIYNYTLHRLWTFRHQQAANGSVPRYVAVTAAASLLDVVLFHELHVIVGIYDFVVLVFNGLTIAIFTFFSHRLFTFHNDPWKRTPRQTPDTPESAGTEDVVQS